MKVYQINIFGNLSTGKIAVDIYKVLKAHGHDGKIAFARGIIEDGIPHYKIGTDLDVKIHALMTRITDKTGFYSKKATLALIEDIKAYNPDVIHLHNIHGYYLNIEVLFNFLKECGKPVVWTLHDCWAFTGHCAYYSAVGCDKWKTGCHACPQKKEYPASAVFDHSKWNYQKKKELFTNVPKMTIVTVSQWLAGETRKSFLASYPIQTIYNGIDLTVFKPTPSDFRKKYQLEDKFIVLGVASTWAKRKGLDDFVTLSNMLDANYKIVVVGVSAEQKKALPNNILAFERTNSVRELAEIYTAADVYFNASVEETFGLPTVEAMACETVPIVYDATALPEIVVDDSFGFVVQQRDWTYILKMLKQLQRDKLIIDREQVVKCFSKEICFEKYIEILEEWK